MITQSLKEMLNKLPPELLWVRDEIVASINYGKEETKKISTRRKNDPVVYEGFTNTQEAAKQERSEKATTIIAYSEEEQINIAYNALVSYQKLWPSIKDRLEKTGTSIEFMPEGILVKVNNGNFI